jgi:hypothetical protein
VSSGPVDDTVLSVETGTGRRRIAEDAVIIEPAGWQAADADASLERVMASYARYLDAGMPGISHDTLDDTHILNRWIAGHSDHPAVFLLDRDRIGDRAYWRSLLSHALGLPDEALSLEVTGPGGNAHESQALSTAEPAS